MKIQHARWFFFARLGPAFRLDPIFHFRWVIRKKRTPISAHGPQQSDQPPPRATGIKESPRLLPLSTFPSASHTHTSAFHPHNNNHHQQLHPHLHKNHQQWLALSRPPESPLVARPLASSSLPRLVSSHRDLTRHASLIIIKSFISNIFISPQVRPFYRRCQEASPLQARYRRSP